MSSSYYSKVVLREQAPLKNRTPDPLFEVASTIAHRFWCGRHRLDYVVRSKVPCGRMVSECPECARRREEYNAANAEGRLGPAAFPSLNRCWCRSEVKQGGMGWMA